MSETVEQAYERGQRDMLRVISEALGLAGRFDEAQKALKIIPVAYSEPKPVDPKELILRRRK